MPPHGTRHSPVTPLPLSHSPTNLPHSPFLSTPVFPEFSPDPPDRIAHRLVKGPFFLLVPALYGLLPALQERNGPRLVQSKADPRSPQPGTQLLQPLIVTDIGYALPSKAIHPSFRLSLSKGHQSCSWLAAFLKLHWCTSWDLCLAQRLWTGKT